MGPLYEEGLEQRILEKRTNDRGHENSVIDKRKTRERQAAVLLNTANLGSGPCINGRSTCASLPNGSGGRCWSVSPLAGVEETARFTAPLISWR